MANRMTALGPDGEILYKPVIKRDVSNIGDESAVEDAKRLRYYAKEPMPQPSDAFEVNESYVFLGWLKHSSTQMIAVWVSDNHVVKDYWSTTQ